MLKHVLRFSFPRLPNSTLSEYANWGDRVTLVGSRHEVVGLLSNRRSAMDLDASNGRIDLGHTVL